MLTSKKLPWVSLTLLLVTYSILGWLLATVHRPPWVIWLLAGVGALLIAGAMTSALPVVTDILAFTLKSDARAFLVVSVVAFLVVVIISWISAFAHALLVMSAESLARLDLQTYGFNQWQAFWILSIVSLLGLGLGGATHTLISTHTIT